MLISGVNEVICNNINRNCFQCVRSQNPALSLRGGAYKLDLCHQKQFGSQSEHIVHTYSFLLMVNTHGCQIPEDDLMNGHFRFGSRKRIHPLKTEGMVQSFCEHLHCFIEVFDWGEVHRKAQQQ